MKRFFSIENKRIVLTPVSDIALILFASVFITLLTIYIAPESFMAFIGLLKAQPLLFVLNLLPVVIVSVFAYLITNSSALSVFLSGGIFTVFAVSNSIKISMRQDPVLPTDLKLLSEVYIVLKNFSPSDIILTAIIAVLVIALAVIAFIFIRS